ncbi:MAG: hypothetical protein ACXU84_09430 [Xanthobacteraceae bacterium]
MGLQRQRRDLGAQFSQLHYRETGKADAEQQECAKAAIKAPADSEVEKRHSRSLADAPGRNRRESSRQTEFKYDAALAIH